MTRHKREKEMAVSTQYFKDLAERVFFTAAEAALAVGVLEIADPDVVPPEAWYTVPLAALAASLKGLVAKKVGNSESASTVPTV